MFEVPREQVVHTIECRHGNVQSILYCPLGHRTFFDQFFRQGNRFFTQFQQRYIRNRLQTLLCCVFIARARFLDDQLGDEQVKIVTTRSPPFLGELLVSCNNQITTRARG